jgi:hypothetical protein
LIVLAAGCGSSPPPARAPRAWNGQAARMGVVSGYVMDVNTNEPIANAQVTIGGQAVRARSDGTFEASVPAGRARVEVKNDGFLQTVREVAVGGVTLSLPFKLVRKAAALPVGHAGGMIPFGDVSVAVPVGAFTDGSSIALTFLDHVHVAAIANRPQFIDTDGTPRRAVATVDLDASQAPATPVRVRVPVPAEAGMDSVRGFVIDSQGQWSTSMSPVAVAGGIAEFELSGNSHFGVAIDPRRIGGKAVGYLIAEAGDAPMSAGDVLTGGNDVATATRGVALVDPQGSRIELAPASRARVEVPVGDAPPAGTAAYAGSAVIMAGRARVVVPPAQASGGLIKLSLQTPTLNVKVRGTAFDISSCGAGPSIIDVLEVVEGTVDVDFGGKTSSLGAGQSTTFCSKCAAGVQPVCGASDDGGQPPPIDAMPLSPDAGATTIDAAPIAIPDAAAPDATLPMDAGVPGLDAPLPPDGPLPSDGPLGPPDAVLPPDAPIGPPDVMIAPLDAAAPPPDAMPIVEDAAVIGLDAASTAALGLSPGSYDYGTVALQTISTIVDYTVTNDGAVATGPLTAALSSTEFYIVGDSCTGTMLAPQAMCVVSVKLYPSSVGPKSATLTVGGSPGGTAVATLTGVGAENAKLDVTPTAYNFGPWAPGQTSSNATFTVTNVGGVSTGAPTVTVTGTDNGAFPVIANVCTNALAPNDTCQILVVFVPPSAIGQHKAQLELYGNPGNNVAIPLFGNSSYVDVTPKAHDFGNAKVSGGNVVSYDFHVKNIGDSGGPTIYLTPAISGADNADFTVTNVGCPNGLLPGAPDCIVTVSFRPGATGAKTASLDMGAKLTTGAPAGTDQATLTGTAN